MKHFITTITDRPIKTLLLGSLLFTVLIFTACKKYEASKSSVDSVNAVSKNNEIMTDVATHYSALEPQTLWELQQAHAATAKYQNIENAFADNYGNVPLVVIPNMGYHFLKAQFINPVFDLKKPALLVYNKKDNGNFELVAVEYAVPIDPQAPGTPPEGFTGNTDEWDFNTLNSGWWTLHAWIWKNNPDGVFKMMNPAVNVQ